MGRVFTVDLRRVDPDVRRGQQSYPLAIDGTLYVTTNNNFAFAIDGATGKVKWEYRPKNSGLFVNFGVAANRGLAYCGGKLFMTTLDMQLVALRPSDGEVAGKIAISQFVPNASANYGYSQTSAPICAGGKLVMGAAGSEYGVRGYVMAFNTDLTPAWPNPYWTIPPEQQQWRRLSRIVGGGVVWTPVTIDARTSTVYFGTGSGTPNFYHDLHPGPNPRANSLIAVDLGHREAALVAAARRERPVELRRRAAADRLRREDRREDAPDRLGRDARRASGSRSTLAPGEALHERVKVIDRVEHPPLRPGEPVTIFPSALGGVNYSPASYDPKTNYVFNAAAETAAVLIQDKLTPTQKRRKLIQGDVFLGLQNGNFGANLASWHDHGSISAINVATGRRVWKFQTPEPERGGVTTTASGLGFAGGGDGVLRAFDVKTGKMLWRFQTGAPIAAGPTLYLNGGKEYLAITVGGTPTSSNGGTLAELQVFAIGGSQNQSPPPSAITRAAFAAADAPRVLSTPSAPQAVRAPAAAAKGGARIATGGPIRVRAWLPSGNNTESARGRLLVGGKPVSGARISVDRYVLPRATGADGRFTASIDVTVVRRHLVKVADLSRARVGGRAAHRLRTRVGPRRDRRLHRRLPDRRAEGERRQGRQRRRHRPDRHARRLRAGGRQPLHLPALGPDHRRGREAGRGCDRRHAHVDRDFWTFSEPSDADGNYTSFFAASDKSQDDPVPLSVQVALGPVSYSSGLIPTVKFKRLRSARMDVQLPARVGGVLPLPTSTSYEGAVYQGLLVGASVGGRVVKPVAAQWPDAKGRFRLVLPASARGKTVRLWQSSFQAFATFPAKPGGAVDLRTWPAGLSPRVSTGTASVQLPD